MSNNQKHPGRFSRFFSPISRLWQRTIQPHPSIKEIGQIQQAQFTAGLALVMLALTLLQLVISVINASGQVTGTLSILALVVALVYILSRSRYPQIGSGLLVGGFTMIAFVLSLQSDWNVSNILTGMIPIAYLLAAILLPIWGQVIIVAIALIGTMILGAISPDIPASELTVAFGNMIALGVVLIMTSLFRNNVERQRLAKLAMANEELRQASIEVEQSTQRVRTMFAAMPDGIGITDPRGLFIEANQSMAQLAGLTEPAQLIGHSATEYIAPSDRDRADADFDSGAALEDTIDYRMRGADGREFDGELTAAPLTDEQDQPAGFVIVARDISRRKQAQQGLQENQRLLQLVMDNIPQAVFWKSRDLVYLGANQAFAEDAGLESADEIAGKTDFDMPWQEQAELYRTDDQAVMDKGEDLLNYEEPQTSPTGDTTWLRTSKIPIKDEAGNVFAVLGMYEDITEQKHRDTFVQNQSQALANLARSEKLSSGDLQTALEEITSVAAQTLNTKRTSIWTYDAHRTKIECIDLYVDGEGHSTGLELEAKDFPGYFEALKEDRIIAVSDAHTAPQTREFSETYLTPLGINSMLDAPIRLGGQMIGVVCNEHIGPDRNWTPEEQSFATSIADFVASAYLAQERHELQLEIQKAFDRRGYQVQISTEIAQEITEAASMDELYEQVVTLTKERLDYYHTQLLRYEPTENAVVLLTGYGEIGAQMQQQGHRMALGSGLIGTAAQTGQTVLRPNLTEAPNWQPNPLLPETKGEIAVPIKLGDTILGILDVQSDQVNGLTDDDQILLEGICGQIAVAFENTRLRQEMQDRLTELDSLSRSMSVEAWREYQGTTSSVQGYTYNQNDLQPQTEWLPTMAAAVQKAQVIAPDEQNTVAAVPLSIQSGEAIGALGVYDDPQHPLSAEEMDFIEQAANQITQALESARLFNQTQASLAETEELYQSSEQIVRAETLQDVLLALVNTTRLADLNRASLMLFESYDSAGKPDTVVLVAQRNKEGLSSTLPDGARLNFDDLGVVNLMKPDEPMIMRDIRVDERISELERQIFKDAGIIGSVFLPLFVGNQWIGFVTANTGGQLTWSEDDIRQIMALTGQAATVIQSKLLFERAQTRAQREQALRQITAAVRSSTDPATIMRTAVRELGTALGRSTQIRFKQTTESSDEDNGNS